MQVTASHAFASMHWTFCLGVGVARRSIANANIGDCIPICRHIINSLWDLDAQVDTRHSPRNV